MIFNDMLIDTFLFKNILDSFFTIQFSLTQLNFQVTMKFNL